MFCVSACVGSDHIVVVVVDLLTMVVEALLLLIGIVCEGIVDYSGIASDHLVDELNFLATLKTADGAFDYCSVFVVCPSGAVIT